MAADGWGRRRRAEASVDGTRAGGRRRDAARGRGERRVYRREQGTKGSDKGESNPK